MRFAKTIILLLVTFFGFAGHASDFTGLEFKPKKLKDLNRRAKHPVGINVYGIGPGGLANLSMDFFLTPKVALEGGGGFMNSRGDIGYFVGGRYHFFGKSFLNLTPYVGAYTAFHYNGKDLQNHSVYLPFGIHRIKKNKFNWSVEIAYESSIFENNHFSGGFRLGYRF